MSGDVSRYIVLSDQGEELELGPPNAGKIIITVDPKNTGETRFCMLIQILNPGGVVPVHLHEREEQLLFFYAGQGRASLDDQEMEVRPGTTVYAPRGMWNGIANTGTEPLCILETTSPPGPENAFRELSQLAPSSDINTLLQVAAKYRVKIKGA